MSWLLTQWHWAWTLMWIVVGGIFIWAVTDKDWFN